MQFFLKRFISLICWIFVKQWYKVYFCSTQYAVSEADFLIALGGDGTIIEIAVDAAKYEIPIVGINVGTLGFLTQTDKGDYSAIKDVIDNNYGLTECMMLDISIISKDDREVCKFLALNDLIVTGDSYKMITTSTSVDGTNMGRYSADGLIVSTAIGSTAYSLSAGGAVMHPEVDAMIITPICPHTLKARSTVIPGNSTVEIIQVPPLELKRSLVQTVKLYINLKIHLKK